MAAESASVAARHARCTTTIKGVGHDVPRGFRVVPVGRWQVVRPGDALRSGSHSARIQTGCAVVSAPTFDRAFARWCFTVECSRPSRWAAAFSAPLVEWTL